MKFRAYQDNVVLVLDPVESVTSGGIHIPDQARNGSSYKRSRMATVYASGPGYYEPLVKRDGVGGTVLGKFIENQTKPGDRVLVDHLCGQNYDMDITVPRHNKPAEFGELVGERREFRIVREQEILAIVEDE